MSPKKCQSCPRSIQFCIVCFVRQPGRGRVVDVCGQNAVRFVPTRTRMCGLPDCGGRGGEIFRTMKPSPLALPLNFVSCVLSGNRAGGGVDVCGQSAVRFVPTCTRMCGLQDRGGRGGKIFRTIKPSPLASPPEFCIVCFVRQPGRGRVVDICGQNAVRFVSTRTGMCGLPDRGGRGGGRKLGLNIHPEGSSRNLPDEKTPIPERARRCLGMGISAHHFFDAL